MATNTPNLHLIKPDREDFYDVQDFNGNADKIDAAFGEHTGQAVGAEGAHGLRIRDGRIQTASGDQWTDVSIEATDVAIGSVDGLREALDDKSDITHTHTADEVGAVTLVEGKAKAEQASAAIVALTEGRELVLSDAGKLLCVDAAADITLTIPTDAGVAFPVGTEIEVMQEGAGTVTFVGADTSVTLHSFEEGRETIGQYAVAVLKKKGANNWRLAGAVE